MVAKIEPETRVCPVCDGEFEVGGVGRPPRTAKYCSRRCGRAASAAAGKYAQCLELTEAQAAYLAGVIDADGHVGIYLKGGTGSVRLDVSNTDQALHRWMIATTGIGSIQKGAAERPGCKATFNWTVSGPSAVSLLKQIRRFMMVKAERADLAIEYQELLADPRNRVDLELRTSYRERMLKLNRRGPALPDDGR